MVEESTQFREEEKPLLLDLIFTKKPEPPPSIQYFSPMGRSDYVTLMLEMQEDDGIRYREEYKKERLNYARANFEKLRNFFVDIGWRNIMNRKTIQGKYEVFLQKYNKEEKKYIPICRVKKSTHDWYNARCIEAKREKNKAWMKLKKLRNENY
ncbi:hypothetical protein E2C01_054185 [Portunus trituberculatus]|uniref:Uncharacterized protein n=1 Tax=Portunus trituberculatus TaxID=210409 RepID=A0A5B7GSI1_PORTR|nr:hypothetical protein [Portunus trituberculatus]